MREGAERRKALRHSLAPRRRGRVLCDQHARLPALHLWRFFELGGPCFRVRTGKRKLRPDPGGLAAALHPVHVQPLKAALHLVRWARTVIRDDPRTLLTWNRGAGATPCSAYQTSPEDALS